MRSKDDVARELAETHYRVEPGMVEIFRIRNPNGTETDPKEPIKLLEVNAETSATGIIPLYFPPIPEHDIAYASVIIEITPEEATRLHKHELTLPNNWMIGDRIPNPAACQP